MFNTPNNFKTEKLNTPKCLFTHIYQPEIGQGFADLVLSSESIRPSALHEQQKRLDLRVTNYLLPRSGPDALRVEQEVITTPDSLTLPERCHQHISATFYNP